MNRYDNRLHILTKEYDELISRENEKILPGNGVFERYKYPILTICIVQKHHCRAVSFHFHVR